MRRSLVLVSVLHSVLQGGHVNIGLQTEVVRWIIIIIIGHGGNLYGLIKIVAGSMQQLCYLDMILNEFQLKSERKMIELHFSSISWATVGCSIPFSTQMYLNYWKIKVDQNQLQDFVSHPQRNFYDCCANLKKTKQFTGVTLFSVQKIKLLLKALVVNNSVLHDFGFGKVSPAKQLQLHQEGFVNPRHFSKTEVVQNTVLNH